MTLELPVVSGCPKLTATSITDTFARNTMGFLNLKGPQVTVNFFGFIYSPLKNIALEMNILLTN